MLDFTPKILLFYDPPSKNFHNQTETNQYKGNYGCSCLRLGFYSKNMDAEAWLGLVDFYLKSHHYYLKNSVCKRKVKSCFYGPFHKTQ